MNPNQYRQSACASQVWRPYIQIEAGLVGRHLFAAQHLWQPRAGRLWTRGPVFRRALHSLPLGNLRRLPAQIADRLRRIWNSQETASVWERGERCPLEFAVIEGNDGWAGFSRSAA